MVSRNMKIQKVSDCAILNSVNYITKSPANNQTKSPSKMQFFIAVKPKKKHQRNPTLQARKNNLAVFKITKHSKTHAVIQNFYQRKKTKDFNFGID